MQEGDNEEGSDSSDEEVGPRNTIGDVPLEFYRGEEHLGYNLAGRKLKKKDRLDKLDNYLHLADDPESL